MSLRTERGRSGGRAGSGPRWPTRRWCPHPPPHASRHRRGGPQVSGHSRRIGCRWAPMGRHEPVSKSDFMQPVPVRVFGAWGVTIEAPAGVLQVFMPHTPRRGPGRPVPQGFGAVATLERGDRTTITSPFCIRLPNARTPEPDPRACDPPGPAPPSSVGTPARRGTSFCHRDTSSAQWSGVHQNGATPELKVRTLTNLYNARPQWLADAHASLDAAVVSAYGWPEDVEGDDALGELLALNTAGTVP